MCFRKKHHQDTKEDIENAIGYNRFMTDTSSSSKSGEALPDASSPVAVETNVCKYCGEDFKFYRALKHHLRSQTSCQHKPFLCKVCGIGFSTKANCLRHIQKQHRAEAEGLPIEHHMQVNEELLDAQSRAREAVRLNSLDSGDSPSLDTGGSAKRQLVSSSDDSESPVKFARIRDLVTGRVEAISLKKPAHSNGQPSMPLSIPYVKLESDDQPLDFSIKSRGSAGAGPPPQNIIDYRLLQASTWGNDVQTDLSDEPIDLTTRPPRSSAQRELLHSSQHLSTAITMHRLSTGYHCMGGIEHFSADSSLDSAVSEDLSVSTLPVPVVDASLSNFGSAAPSHADPGFLRYKKDYHKFYAGKGLLQCPYCSMIFKHGLKVCLVLFCYVTVSFCYLFSLYFSYFNHVVV